MRKTKLFIAAISLSTVLSVAVSGIAPAMAASDATTATKKKCDQKALAAYVAYRDARKAILAAYKTVIDAAYVTYQAALESGWGTSRGAQRSASPFGQMVFLDNDRSKIRPFEELAHSVEAYANNLNTHKAYARFRLKRAEQRARGATPDGYDLAQTLSAYSERKSDYVRDVRGIIKANKLQKLDKAQLEG